MSDKLGFSRRKLKLADTGHDQGIQATFGFPAAECLKTVVVLL